MDREVKVANLEVGSHYLSLIMEREARGQALCSFSEARLRASSLEEHVSGFEAGRGEVVLAKAHAICVKVMCFAWQRGKNTYHCIQGLT